VPDTPSTDELLAFALELASAADVITMRYYRGAELATQAKADASLVTRADLEVEAALRGRIAERYPDHAFLGEEDGLHGGPSATVRWIVDPIDGTHSYARGIPVWATLIACQVDGVLTVGVASAPALGTRWWAGRGLGTWRAPLSYDTSGGMEEVWAGTAERVHVSAIARLEEAQLLYGSFRLTFDAWDGRAVELLRAAWRTRSFSDFWGYCLVAEGSAEAMIEAEISPWDIAAMLVIVEEAGGRLTDLDGRPTIEAGHAIASNGALHEELLARLRPPSA
jgi:histidinol-phosphatase